MSVWQVLSGRRSTKIHVAYHKAFLNIISSFLARPPPPPTHQKGGCASVMCRCSVRACISMMPPSYLGGAFCVRCSWWWGASWWRGSLLSRRRCYQRREPWSSHTSPSEEGVGGGGVYWDGSSGQYMKKWSVIGQCCISELLPCPANLSEQIYFSSLTTDCIVHLWVCVCCPDYICVDVCMCINRWPS